VSFEFRASTAGDIEEVAGLIRTAFRAHPQAPFLDRGLLQWKYFVPGPDWNGARSYLLRHDGSLVAHGCAWPVKLMFERRSYSALTLLDWVASKTSLSAGLQLVGKMASLADILISIGGSEATRKILPRIGFRTVDVLHEYARVLRPWRQFRTRPSGVTPREIARLARNTGYSLRPRASSHGWSLRQVTTLDATCIEDSSVASGPASLHTSAFLEYMTRCPAARITCFELLKESQPAGYAVISLVNRQCRIAEIRLHSREQTDWSAAVSATVETAIEFPEACELVAWTSEPHLRCALEANGFQPRDHRSVFVQDSRNLIAFSGTGWDLTMLDDDSAFLNFPERPYAT
jgi:hypothetical protein